jgi:hypothetical protein
MDRGKVKQLQPAKQRRDVPYYAQNFVAARSPVSGQGDTWQMIEQPKSFF